MKKIIQLCLLLVCGVASAALAQNSILSGTVSSSDGETLPGATVVVKGENPHGTTTEIDGTYRINVAPGDVVVFSFVGFLPQEFEVGNRTQLDVVLQMDETALDEVVVVGFGEAKRITMTGAVSAVKGADIRDIPTPSVQNTLQGRMPGFFSQQRSGQPGRDASDFFIRGVSSLNPAGNEPLIIVDDIQYSYDQLSQINVNEIESISILKDASTTAIYGIKGANGVLVVKTRRGTKGAPKINLRVEQGFQTPVRRPSFLDAYNTATLVNEAYRNDGLNEPFNEQDLEAFKNGTDPYGHPDVNWYDVVFKQFASQRNANLDISGGDDKLRYFINGGAFSQNGLVKDFSDPNNEVNNNYFYRRFNYRTNLDFDVSKTTSLRLDVTTRFMNINEPRGQNVVSEIYNFAKIRPYSAPPLNPDGSYTYAYDTDEKLPTINARIANGGYSRTRRTDMNFLFGFDQDLGFITKGLSAEARIAYSSIEENNRQVFRSSYPTYHYDPESDTYSIDPRGNYAYGTYAVLGNQNYSSKNINLQAFLNYSNTFDEDHSVAGTFLFNRQSSTAVSWAAVPNNFQGFTAKTAYTYKDKFLIDFNLGYNGTDRFESGERYGFFPALGLGYSISQEPFFKEKFPKVDLLKLRMSYGLVGSDRTTGDRYLYRQVYYNGGGYTLGETAGIGYPTIYEGDLGNPNVTWEKSRKFDVGVDGDLFNNRVTFTIDYFHEYRFDQLVTKEDIPLMLGVGVAPTNVAETQNQGFDGQIGYRFYNRKGLEISTNFVFSYAKNKILYKAEAQQAYPWLAETGESIGQPFGYTFEGFYTDEDIATLNDADPNNNVAVPQNDVPVQAGDLKYKDLNGDGILDNIDQGPIGMPNLPNTTLGWSTNFFYKGISASFLFQGSFGYSFSVVGTGIESFKSQFQPIHLERWTPETADTATFPRLTTNPTTVNSSAAYPSDFWLIDAWYIRLKTIDIGYELPASKLPWGINKTRFYLNAYNLFTWTSYDKYQQDPEISTNTAGDAYLNQRVLNLGLQITF
ncbi:SusC/RagA family TonB-linked outer membrane protein [Echinicola rosea]|uniref:SusC/RagA family TonB-linked outer membrane protein n=1 Tax=Echinicola rosea TaxID=1807691 RepID=UPI0010CA7F0A|nr:TonB-dependent receptor [Echinicola rosea]